MKEKNQKGITLIALIVTIIILIILAGVTISITLKENGVFNTAQNAKEEYIISNYKEQIEIARAKLIAQNVGKKPTINQLKQEFDTNHKQWVASTEIITDNDKEKLKLITKEGYIFYITEALTEYKGKGEVVDTSALKRNDVIELKVIKNTENGKEVKITSLAENYYKLVYQINAKEDSNWTEIKSTSTVEVPYGEILYAKLIFGSDSGQIHQISISHTLPTVSIKDMKLSDVKRKTDIPLSSLIDVTWGSEGTGKVYYTVNGNLKFNNKEFFSTEITNLSQLELGTYSVTYGIATPSEVEQNVASYDGKNIQVKITGLADATVTNNSNISETAYAIYSEYDLAYFRDLVNGGEATINGKLMKDIELLDVSSVTNGGWAPIGYWNGADWNYVDIWPGINFMGIFEGNDKAITITSLSKDTKYKSSGLFGQVIGGTVRNLTVNGTIDAECVTVGAITGGIQNGTLYNCINNSNITSVTKSYKGGIAGLVTNSTIEKCTNNGTVYGKSYIGGIAGDAQYHSIIKNCTNTSNVACYGTETIKIGNKPEEVYGIVGGIAGNMNNSKIENCTNTLDATISGNTPTILPNGLMGGGIVGLATNNSTISKSNNKGAIEFNSLTKYDDNYGGLAGIVGCLTESIVDQCYNTGSVKSTYASSNGMKEVGGVVGYADSSTIKNAYNVGAIKGGEDIGGVIGQMIKYYGLSGDNYLRNCYNISDSVEATSNNDVHNFSGHTEYVNYHYCGWYKEAVNKYYDKDSTYNNCKEYNSLEEMKSSGEELLAFLKNDEGTKDGESLWAQDSNINNGLPYLVNNMP